MTISEKSAYLKGLADGMKLDCEKAEGKLIKELIDLVAEIAGTVETVDNDVSELYDYVDEMDQDLADVEEIVFDLDEDEDDDEYEFGEYDDDDYEDCDGECEGCHGCDDIDETEDVRPEPTVAERQRGVLPSRQGILGRFQEPETFAFSERR